MSKIQLSPSLDEKLNEISIPVNGVDSSEGFYTIPGPISAKYLLQNKPSLPPEIIRGILRQGEKMMITSKSKAGKSMLVMELAAAVASGSEWLGHKCEKGRVLYVNTELQKATIADRYEKVKKTLGITEDVDENIFFWNLRGYAAPLGQYAKEISDQVIDNKFHVVIIDPIYKLMEGSENDQAVITSFCNSVDLICNAGASVVYVHHHRKGNLGDNDPMDRGSGSGVFARDADAMIDLVRLYNSGNDVIDPRNPDVSAWNVSYVLRSFRSPEDMTFLYDYPIHKKDVYGLAKNAKPKTSQSKAGRVSGEQSASKKKERIERARNIIKEDPDISDIELSKKLDVCVKTARNYMKEIDATERK